MFDMLPIETKADARLRPGSFMPPAALTVFMSVFGQSDMRPWAGPPTAASVRRDGLSQTRVGTSFRKKDPSYPSRA